MIKISSVELLRIIEWLEKMKIRNYSINEDGTVDVEGDVDISDKGLVEIPVQFNRVSGIFYCSHNQLTSLEGAPMKVGGSFYCDNNQLTSLEGAPMKVVGGFDCSHNRVKFSEEDVNEVCRV